MKKSAAILRVKKFPVVSIRSITTPVKTPVKTQVTSKTALLVCLLLNLFVWPLKAETFFHAQHKHLQYAGRVDFSSPQQAYLTWPGNSVTFRFTGQTLRIKLKDEQGKNYYYVIFNQNDLAPYVLAAQKGEHEYDLSHMIDSSSAITEVKVFKRTEGEEGGSYLVGISLADNAKLLEPPARPTRKIAFYGDSVTVGMGNESAHNGPDHLPQDKNHYLSYAAITARSLNAEFHSIAKSGIGFMISWFDFIMPDYYQQLTAESNNNSVWDFTRWTPDVVVVNLGQNDRWLIENEQRLQVSDEQIIGAYQAFVDKLLAKHPNAYFICALGSMDATASEKWPNYIKSAVGKLKQAHPSRAIKTLMFDYTGYGAHPRVDQHIKNAEKLTSFIRSELAW